MMRAAVFLDRDGVLVEDSEAHEMGARWTLLEGVPWALTRLKTAGYLLITVSNQAAVARGRCSEEHVMEAQRGIEEAIVLGGGPSLDAFYFCPHHPDADVLRYRRHCDCRKPAAGLILEACREHDIDPRRSFMIGDRLSDIHAGQAAGCRTIWAQTGRHDDPPIVGAEGIDVRADYACDGLPEAVRWIIEVAA